MKTLLKNRTRMALATLGLAAFLAAPSVRAGNGDWARDAAGTWSVDTNWSLAAIPGTAADDVVGLTFDITAARTVTIDTTNRTVGVLNIGDTNATFFPFTLAASGGGKLIFDTTVGNAQLNKATAASRTNDFITAPFLLNTNLDIANSSTTGVGTITFSNSITAGTAGTKTLANVGTGNALVTLIGIIGDGSGTMSLLQNVGSFAQTLDVGAINTYSGGTFINGGILRLRTDLGGGARLGPGTVTVAAGASYEIWATAQQTITNAIVLNGPTGVAGRPAINQDGGAGKVILIGTITLNATSDIGIGGLSSNDMDIQGEITGPGGMIVDERGISAVNRVLTLTGTNTYTGPTTIKGGTLTIAGNGSLGTGSYDGAITNNAAFIYSSSSNQTLSGVISGTGTVTMAGASTLTLSGTNTYVGTTTVSTGTLTLVGNRTVAGGTVSVGSGGTATLNIQGDLPFAGNNPMYVGLNTTGIVNHSAGMVTFNAGNTLELLIGNGGNGIYNLSGSGVLNIGASASRGIMIGVNPGTLASPRAGAFNMSGGTINNASLLMIPRDDVAASFFNSSYTQTGGTSSNQTLTLGGSGANGANSTAALSITGGTFVATTFSNLSRGTNVTSTITIAGTADVTLAAFPTNRGTGSSANLIFDGGTLRPAAASATYMGGLTSAKIRAGGATFDVASGRDITVTQSLATDLLSTGGGLSKAGSGTLTLAGTNTYDGPTTINAGSLLVNRTNTVATGTGTFTVKTNCTLGGSGTIDLSAVGQNVVIENGGKLAPGSAANTAGTLTLALEAGSLDLSAAAGTPGTLVFDLGATNTSDRIAINSGTLNIGTGLLNFASFNFQIAAGFVNATNTYTLIQSTNLVGTLAGSGLSGTLLNGLTATVAISGYDVVVNLSGVEGVIVQPVTWKGTLSGLWDNVLTNWVQTSDGITAAYYADGDAVTFDDSAAGNTTISGSPVAPGSVTVSNTTKAYTLNSVITGTNALTKWGTNVLNLAGSNTYTGGTTLNVGILNINTTGVVGVSGPLGNSGTLTINGGTINNASGAAVVLANVNPIAVGGDFVFTGSSALGLPGTIDLSGTNRSIAVNANTLTLNGSISNGGLTKAGGGTLTLSGNSSFSGGTVINAGVLSVTADSNLGAANGSIAFNGGQLTVPGANISAARIVNVDIGGGAIQVSGNNNFTTSGKLTGSGVLTLIDPGGGGGKAYNFNSTSNDFTGRIIINGGAGVALSVNSFADSANNIAFTAGSGSAPINYGASAIAPLTFASTGRAIEINSAGTYTATIQNNNTTHAITINKDLVATGAGTKTLSFGSVAGPNNVFAGNISNGIGGGTVGVTKNGGGTWALSGTNTYTGATSLGVGGGGVLIFQNAGQSLPSTTAIDIPINNNQVNTIKLLSDTGGSTGTLTLGNTLKAGLGGSSGSATMAVFVGNNGAANGGNGAGGVTGSTIVLGTLDLRSSAEGGIADGRMVQKVGVTGANSYKLQFGNVIMPARGTGGSNGGFFNPTTAPMIITGTVKQNNGRTAADNVSLQTLVLDGTNPENLISGAIKNATDFDNLSNTNALATSLTKQSSSTWTLSGTNTYTGVTTINGGTLVVSWIDNVANASPLGLSSAAATNLVLGNGGTLKYTGATASTDRGFTLSGASATLDASGTGAVSFTSTDSPAYGTAGQTRNLILAGANTDTNTMAASIANNGAGAVSLTKAGPGTWVLSGTNTYSGVTTVTSGTLRVEGSLGAGAVNVVGGTLGGNGTIGGTVTNKAIVAPGASAGILTVNGDYKQTAAGSLNIEIGGTTPGVNYDQLVVNGNATLAGTLNVTFTNGYTGVANDSFTVLQNSLLFGTFATTNLPALGGGNGWNVEYLAGGVVLSITNAGGPPPATGYNAFSNTYVLVQGPEGDDDGDGYANLLEYVTGGSPTNIDTLARMNGTRVGGLLALQFTRTSNSVDTTIIVEGSSATTNNANWIGIATNIGGSWGGATNIVETNGPALFNVTAYDTDPSTNRFLRLRVTRP